MRATELQGVSFTCLEGCGFCCTFQPEVSSRELVRLSARLKPKPMPVTVGQDGRSYLRLQGGCGACTLLERRGCTQYDLRPQHCRYFPFHLHFADETEVYLNYTCRGVERKAGGDLSADFKTNVLDNARDGEIAEHEKLAREAYGEFKRRARRAGVWGDVDAATAEKLARGAALFTDDGLRALATEADLDDDLDALHREALAPFGSRDVARRPFYLTPELEWVTFDHDGKGGLHVLEMDETGALTPRGTVSDVASWRAPPAEYAGALHAYVERLTARRVFAGSVYALVDDDGYETCVVDATSARFVELVCDLALRVRILESLGVTAERIPEEVARFYDTTFLDTPTIGGFL